jgi:gas vesicle protein
MNDYRTFGKYRQSEGNNNTATIVTFLLVGLGLGALTALMLAPKTGRQMRRTLRRKYEDARERVDDFSDRAGEYYEKSSKWANAAKKRVGPIAERFSRG